MKENSIEEDMKIVEKLIKTIKEDRDEFKDGKTKEMYDFFYNAMNNILSDYKRVLKENEELKIDNDIMKQDLNGNVLYVDELEENYILRDKIEKILDEAEITDFNSLVEMFLKINKLLESE